MNRLELVAETLRAALNELATVAPAWLQALAPLAWYARYSKRIEDTRLPQGQAKRDAGGVSELWICYPLTDTETSQAE